MSTREEVQVLLGYVLGRRSKETLESSGLEAVSKEARIAALRGLQDLGWINHSGNADVEESYSLTKEGRRIPAERPPIESLDQQVREHIEALQQLGSENPAETEKALRRLTAMSFDQGNWDSALSYSYELRKFAEIARNPDMAGFAKLYEGHVERAQSRWDEALESYLAALELYTDAGDRRGVCAANRALGIVYGSKGDHTSATRFFETSLSLANELGDADAANRAEANLAIVYSLQGRFEESERANKNCLARAMRAKDFDSAVRISNNLGVSNMSRDRFDASTEHFETAIELSRSIKSREVLGAALINAGYSYAKGGETAKSTSYTDEAVGIFKESNDWNMLALAYRNYGYIEFRKGSHDVAFQWFEKSVRSAEASGVKDTFAACCYEYGMALIECAANLRLAKKLLKKSSTTYRDLGNLERARAIDSKIASA